MIRRLLQSVPLLLCVLLSSPAIAGSSNKKKDQLSVRIHGESAAEDGDKFSVPLNLLDGRRTALSIMPLLSEHDIQSVYPFKAADGSGGAYLRLDGHGANLLTQYSIEHMGSGKVLAVMIGGRQVADLVVDAPVKDGIFVIPYGLTMAEEARLVNAFPLMGQENAKSQKRKARPFSPTDIILPPKASDVGGASAPSRTSPQAP
jgi:hypothetical protein